jgi:DNA-binding SARP family transcriptional activator/TolB-like protein
METMIRFHTLGAVDLRGLDGAEVRAVLQQPKRLGLLAYLAVASPPRFHRRDSLLALFWPELDAEHARAALRRSLYFLRGELGAQVVNSRGDEEVGVATELLWCDATALEQALAEGDPGRALELYRGALLEGLYVSGAAPEYQDWLDRERHRLRGRAGGAARTLSERAEHGGRLSEAAGWAQRSLELNPDDECALQRLLTLLDRTGDRSAALRAYDGFARRMAQEFELEPSPETRKLVETLRARGERAEPHGTDAAPAAPPDRQGTPGTIVILPFSVRGDPRLAYLGDGMVELLAAKLDGAGGIRIVDSRTLLRFLSASAPSDQPSIDGAAVARHFDAAWYLLGTIVEAGGRLEASAVLYAIDGKVLASVHAAAASESGVFDLVDELARELLAAQRVSPGTRLTRLAALTTGSLPALKAYLAGERELRSGRYFRAMEEFQTAVQADPSFGLAYYRLAAAAAGCALPDLARQFADRGFEHRGRLSPHDHLVFTAQRAWLHGAVREAESAYNAITATYPDDVEAWFHLGDLLFHCNPLRGRSAAEARGPFERVARLEPDHVAALVHLARISAIENRKGEMLDLIERALRAGPDGDQALAMRALRAFTLGDQAAMAAVSDELQRARALTVAVAFSDVALYSGNLAGAEFLARGFIQVARSPELRALCHILVAHVAVAADRWLAAAEELRRAEALDPVWGLEIRALFAALPFMMVSADELDELRESLARWDPTQVGPSSFSVFAMHNGLHPAIRAYLAGLLDVRAGDLQAAAARVDELSELELPVEGVVRSLLVELRARVARAEGRTKDALGLLERTPPDLWFQLTVASPFFSLASQRFFRAELLQELGRVAEAAAWYGTIAERSPYELVYAAPARRRLAEMVTLG